MIKPSAVIRFTATTMRLFQIISFFAGVAAFLASACFVGAMMGDTLWKVGVAIMVGDIVCILLWPSPKRS